MKRFLRVTALVLLGALLLMPGGSAKYEHYFSFAFGAAPNDASSIAAPIQLNAPHATANPNAEAQKGVAVVYATPHVFTGDTLNVVANYYSGGAPKAITNYQQGWYAFVMRGGDGGAGRGSDSGVRSYGGLGGIVAGIVYLEAGKTLYIAAGCSGVGVYAGSVGADMGKINGGSQTLWYKHPAFYGGGRSNTNNGGGGGGASFISLGSAPGSAPSTDIIAVAGGGGGGGGRNATSTEMKAAGGHAGASGVGTTSNPNENPVLNGYVTTTAGTIPYDSGGVKGLVSGGYYGGNRTDTTNIVQKQNTGQATNAGNSDGGGGGGAATQGGQRGQYQPGSTSDISAGSFLQGGRGAHDVGIGSASSGMGGGGGGGGWYGGGGGGRNAESYYGGGGGGSSFVRSDVRPLNSAMLASPLFKDFVSFTIESDADRYGNGQTTGSGFTTAYNIGDANYYQINVRSMIGGSQSTVNHKFGGYRGYVIMLYLGPTNPETINYTQHNFYPWPTWP